MQRVYGVASTERAKDKMKNAGTILELHSGSVNGIPALLLNEGVRRNFDIIVLLQIGCRSFRSNYETNSGIIMCDIPSFGLY